MTKLCPETCARDNSMLLRSAEYMRAHKTKRDPAKYETIPVRFSENQKRMLREALKYGTCKATPEEIIEWCEKNIKLTKRKDNA